MVTAGRQGMSAIRFAGLSVFLLLGGCLEAGDAISGSIEARLRYCHVPPDTVVLCPETKPQRSVLFPRRTGTGAVSSPATK